MSNRKTVRPFSQYSMNEIRQKQGLTDKENFGFVIDSETANKVNDKSMINGHDPKAASWYKDVIELRKKAGEYKVSRMDLIFHIKILKKLNNYSIVDGVSKYSPTCITNKRNCGIKYHEEVLCQLCH